MSIEMALRIEGHTVTRAELEQFTAYLHDMSAEEAWVYVDDEDGDAFVLEARPNPSAKGSAKGSANPSGEGKFDLLGDVFSPREKNPDHSEG